MAGRNRKNHVGVKWLIAQHTRHLFLLLILFLWLFHPRARFPTFSDVFLLGERKAICFFLSVFGQDGPVESSPNGHLFLYPADLFSLYIPVNNAAQMNIRHSPFHLNLITWWLLFFFFFCLVFVCVLALNLRLKKTIDNSRGDNDENNRLVPNVFFQGSSTLDKTKDKNVQQQQPKTTKKTFFFSFLNWWHVHTPPYPLQVSRLNVLELFVLLLSRSPLAHRGKMNSRPYTYKHTPKSQSFSSVRLYRVFF